MDQPDPLMIFCRSWKWRSEPLSLAGQVGNGTRIRDLTVKNGKGTLQALRRTFEGVEGQEFDFLGFENGRDLEGLSSQLLQVKYPEPGLLPIFVGLFARLRHAVCPPAEQVI